MRDRGFTLLEVMVSLAIIGGLLVTLIYTMNYHLGIAARHEFLTTATFLAKNKMFDAEENPVEATGFFPEPFSSYRYSVAIKESPYPGIAEIAVAVERSGEKVQLSELFEKK